MKTIIPLIRKISRMILHKVTGKPVSKSGSPRSRLSTTIMTLFLTTSLLYGSGLWKNDTNSSGKIHTLKKVSATHLLLPSDGNSSFATNRGSLMIGGSLTFQFRKGVDEYEDKSILFEFEPKISAFVVPSFAIGGTILTRYYKYGDFSATTNWGIGPTLTYFIGGVNEKVVYPYLEGSFLFTGNSHIITYSELEFGAMIMVADAVGLTASLKYRLDIHYPEGSQAEHVNNILFGIGIRSFIFR